MKGYLEKGITEVKEPPPSTDATPIEPEGRKIPGPNVLKWLFFAFIIFYVLIVFFHAPILTRIGKILVVEHPPQKSDLIVCLSGRNIERGLAAADAYKRELAPQILVSREELPDGYDLLREKGLQYPESRELLVAMLKELGVPESAILTGDVPVKSTFEEAEAVRALVKSNNYRSLILITSPTHSRRAWLIFKRVMRETETRLVMAPTPYSQFKPEDWWKKRRYVREVILEYEKLIY
ncbi:MAG: YdcF family protein, partial [Proteobacteria bacterium]|nr:YdcF family protein [Pseudomonadota bacterium]